MYDSVSDLLRKLKEARELGAIQHANLDSFTVLLSKQADIQAWQKTLDEWQADPSGKPDPFEEEKTSEYILLLLRKAH